MKFSKIEQRVAMNADILIFPIIMSGLNTPWEKILASGTAVTFRPKFIISGRTSNREADGMYYIKRGCVRLSNISSNGQERIILYMGKGCVFNEVPMLQFSTDYIFTCTEQVEAIFWNKKILDSEFIRKYPELISNLMLSMSKKSQSFYAQLCVTRSYDSFVNVCRALYSMHMFNREKGEVVPRLTQLDLAAFLGIHRSSLHKALNRLEKEGIIGKYSRNKLTIYDAERLKCYVNTITGIC